MKDDLLSKLDYLPEDDREEFKALYYQNLAYKKQEKRQSYFKYFAENLSFGIDVFLNLFGKTFVRVSVTVVALIFTTTLPFMVVPCNFSPERVQNIYLTPKGSGTIIINAYEDIEPISSDKTRSKKRESSVMDFMKKLDELNE